MASIIITSGDQKGEFLPRGRRTSVIGRGENLPLGILDDLVSRKHLRIRFDESTNRYHAEDMGSRHGTLINRRRITNETALTEGDEILMGETNLLFTQNDFNDRESALMHYKKVGERSRPTRIKQARSVVHGQAPPPQASSYDHASVLGSPVPMWRSCRGWILSQECLAPRSRILVLHTFGWGIVSTSYGCCMRSLWGDVSALDPRPVLNAPIVAEEAGFDDGRRTVGEHSGAEGDKIGD
jgi:hypothetical protein